MSGVLAPPPRRAALAGRGDSPPPEGELPRQRGGGRAGTRWTDLRTRVLSALVLAPLALAAVWAGGAPFRLMVVAAACVLAWEWVGLRGLAAHRWPGIVVPAVLPAACLVALLVGPGASLAVLAAGSVVTLLAASSDGKWAAAGVPYIGLGCIAMLVLRDAAGAGLANMVFLLAVVWASDIGAYAAGRLLGGPKLAPSVSPSKTWSGAAGGLLAALSAGVAVASWLGPAAPAASVLPAALLLGLAWQLGDLLESWIKRRSGAKDSSRLIPGHGGLLDRVDGLLVAAPVTALLALIAAPGAPVWRFGA